MVSEHKIVGDVRHITSDGETWAVYELSGASYDRRRSLVFESSGTIRRVRNFPADWRTLRDSELYAWSWQA